MDGPSESESWPDWQFDLLGVAELARYVDTSYTASLVPAGLSGSWQRSEGLARARALYEELRSRRIRYAREPWNPARFLGGRTPVLQRIRGPQQTVQGPATCLDLALVLAGMALSVEFRTFLGIRGGTKPHALVVLDLSAPRGDDARRPLPGFAEAARQGDNRWARGVWQPACESAARPHALEAPAASGDWLVVDVYQAAVTDTEPQGREFLLASGRRAVSSLREDEAGAEQFRRDAGGRPGEAAPWYVVDVDLARGDLPAYVPPRGQAIPPIHSYLPAVPAFTAYAARRRLMDDLTALIRAREKAAEPQPDQGTVVVLQGPSGYGKSMLAHELASAADRGCGWFLTATDAKVLTSSLAQAEREEQGWRGEQPDATEERALAAQALGRLRASALPWVVVLDNCDVPPGAPELADRIPRPAHAGQVVIITTTCPDWERYAQARDWRYCPLPALGEEDLTALGLPASVAGAVAGRPLIAQALSALAGYGGAPAGWPEPGHGGADDGPELVWSLVRSVAGETPGVTSLARTLGWCPPEPLNAASALAVAGTTDGLAAGPLDRMRFLTRSPGSGDTIQMHRLFARAVRGQTWRDTPATAAAVIARLMTDDRARLLFIGAADTSALRLLEGSGTADAGAGATAPGEVARAAGLLPDAAERGLLWHGLGRIRERRGPVRESAPHFRLALEALDRDRYPSESAEAMIGLARVTYQNSQATKESLTEARSSVAQARELLTHLADPAARQLSEQGNALSWLIARTLAEREPDPVLRAAQLAEVCDQLWRSYEQRLRIARKLADQDPVGRSAPDEKDGQGPERAYYNLAGAYLLLARTHHELALAQPPGTDARAQPMARAEEALGGADAVYHAVRDLREKRYAGRVHPHLAACVNGLGLVAYYRAVLLGDIAAIPAALGFAALAFEQRSNVAGEITGGRPAGVLRDSDVRKSASLMLKAAIASCWFAEDGPAKGEAAAVKILTKATEELSGSPATYGIA